MAGSRAAAPHQRGPVTPQMRGRYPGFDVMAQERHWDAATRAVIARRLAPSQSLRFFTEEEARTLTAFCDAVLAQDDEPRVPVLAYVDERLSERRFDGFRYADMPSDEQTWRLLAQGLDEAARARGHDGYGRAPAQVREDLCRLLAEGQMPAGEAWEQVPRAWKVSTRYILSAFYAHPWAWNEIGFPGPAYPRGYSRLGADQRESFEAAEASGGPPR